MPRRGLRRPAFGATLALTLAGALLASPLLAQLQAVDVGGQVLGPAGEPVAAARVVVMDRVGATVASAEAGADGRFVLARLGSGDYWVRAETESMRSPLQRLFARTSPGPALTLRLAPHAQEDVDVSASEAPPPDVRVTLAGETVRRLGGRLQNRALQSAIATTPGWGAEDNGLLHYRGVDDGFLYVLDGVPVYERLDPLFGLAPAASTIASVQILDGYVPPEYGLRSGGVIDLRSVSGDGRRWGGTLDAGLASFSTWTGSAVGQGPAGPGGSLLLSVAGERSQRFLDPVHPDNLHNTGNTRSAEAEYLRAGTRDVQSLRAGIGRSSFEVPNDVDQEDAGQDERQGLRQAFATFSWQRTWSTSLVSQAAVFARWTSSRLDPSAQDTPLSVSADRSQRRIGALLSVTHERGRHTVKAGMEVAALRLRESFGFAVTNPDDADDAGLGEAALGYTQDAPFDFQSGVDRPQYSLFLQDSWHVTPRFTAELGVRYDHTRLLLDEHSVGPRLGLSYRLPGESTVLRASVNRLYQPAQPEYLLLASSEAARALSPFASQGGGADIKAERQTALELAVSRKLGPTRLDLAVWQRRIRNQTDPNVLFGTNIVFPNSVARGRAEGLDVRLELPRRGRVSSYLSYTLARVVQFGPINGGLFLEDEFQDIGPGTRFTPDHDQRHIAAFATTYQDDRRGLTATVAARYQSGTPVELPEEALAELSTRPGSELVDIEAGRVKPLFVVDAIFGARLKRWKTADLSARGAVLNLADRAYAFNFGNPFSGTHFGSPRSATLGLVLATR